MKFDFTTIMDRKGKDALAVDMLSDKSSPRAPKEGFDIIPMWVADMNFATAPSIVESMRARLDHPLFGYFMPRPEFYDALISWQEKRNGVTGLEQKHISFVNGVLGGVIAAVNAVASSGDPILLHSPTYVGFTGVLEHSGFKIVHSPLTPDEDGVWRMDFDDMEEKIVKNNIHAAVFCSPHNPCGRVWEQWEIEKAMEVFRKHDVYVISDEIWSDIIRPGYRHIPTQSVSEDAAQRTVAMYAPTKTFNLAGIPGSYAVIYNDFLRTRVNKIVSMTHLNSMHLLSMYAMIGGFSEEGAAWVDELCQVIAGNTDYAVDYIRAHWPGIQVMKPQGTYMMYIDATEWCSTHGVTLDEVLGRAWDVGVAMQDGRPFHGPCHIRMNLALPLSRVQEAFDRLNKYVFI
ncbi:MAG: aminotransferase class I/II-fold pyridoxal phosphate-dependent enzyme [Clostridiales bacterium]|nr:aminotransferase class I/II-fold pyridoxal phosphate-dependent enzyme [Clostridiales bacterium]